MRANYRANTAPQFRVLSEGQLEELFLATLGLMESTGLELHNEEARTLLAAHGAWLDGIRVRIPSFLVRQALATAPRRFTICSWQGDPAKDITISPNRPHWGPGPTCPMFFDPHTGERRAFMRRDSGLVAKVCDALANIDFVEGLSTISDVNVDLADSYEFAEMIANTGKPIVAWSYTLDGCRDIHQMAVAVAGSEEGFIRRPNYVFYCEPSSPLMCTEEAVDKAIYCARHRIPMIFTPCPIGGATAPATAAAHIVQAAAESWLGLVVSQLINPGTPFFMGAVVSIMDMSTMVLAYGAPELSLFQAALTELARYAGLPLWSTGGCTDSKLVDEQAALEGAPSVFFSGLSGADLIHDVGFVESAMAGSLQQVVMMDEAIAMTKRILRGITVDEEMLALDVIKRVGPGGHYISDAHTFKHFKGELWRPRLMDRKRREEWEAEGSRTMGQRAQERLDDILANYKTKPLPTGAQEKIAEILAVAEQRIAKAQGSAERNP